MKKRAFIKGGLIELEPLGIAPSMDVSRPLMLFREIDGTRVLPVWLSHLDAGIAVIQAHSRAKAPSPHQFTRDLLQALEMELSACVFEEVVGHHQFVRVHFAGSRKVKELKTRADHVISLCLHTGCRFFTTLEVLKKSQDVDSELTQTAASLKAAPVLGKNPHPYLN